MALTKYRASLCPHSLCTSLPHGTGALRTVHVQGHPRREVRASHWPSAAQMGVHLVTDNPTRAPREGAIF